MNNVTAVVDALEAGARAYAADHDSGNPETNRKLLNAIADGLGVDDNDNLRRAAEILDTDPFFHAKKIFHLKMADACRNAAVRLRE